MGSVAVLFHAERWVSQWWALGGYLSVGQLPLVNGEPTHTSNIHAFSTMKMPLGNRSLVPQLRIFTTNSEAG